MRAFVLSVLLSQVAGWAGDAHRIVAAIASRFIRGSTKKHIAELLEVPPLGRAVDRALIEASIWADSQEWSSELHFAHTPYRDCSAPFDLATNCGFDGSGRCIVTALANYTVRAADISLPASERAQALKFLVHLVADIHNPLHLGFAEDFGGNSIDVFVKEADENCTLHEVWDSALVKEKQEELLAARPVGSELEPWALSEDLISTISSDEDAIDYKLDVHRSDIETRESAIALMGRMATGIVQTYTCDVAYTNEFGAYIESDDRLTDIYVESRATEAMEMLKLAGVRLAELLNTVVWLFNTRERQRYARAVGVVTTTHPVESLERNPYYMLDIDFDADALVYTGAVETEADPAGVAPIAPVPPVSSVSRKKKEKATTTPAPTTTTLSPEEIRRARNARERARKKLRKRLVQGVDIEKAVLVKRRGKYVVTSADLANIEDYFPVQFDVFLVSFSGNLDSTPMTFLFDVAHFGRQIYSTELIAKTLYKIRDLPYVEPPATTTPAPGEFDEDFLSDDEDELDGPEPPSLSFKRVDRDMARFEGELSMGTRRVVSSKRSPEEVRAIAERVFGWTENPAEVDPAAARKAKRKAKDKRLKENALLRKQYGYLPTKQEVWNNKFKSEFENICAYQYEHIIFYVHKDTLANATSPGIKANIYKAYTTDLDLTTQIYMLLDHRIYDGELTDYVGDALRTVEKKNGKLIKKMAGRRKTMWQELSDINEVYFGTDPKRLENLQVIRMLHSKPANVEESYFRMAWSIHQDDAEKRVDF